MNFLDLILIIPLLWAAWKGFQRGLIFELAMLIGMIVGFYLAFKFSGIFETVVNDYVSVAGSILPYISFLLVFIAVIALVFLLARFLEGILKISALGIFNKIAGSLFGTLKIALALSVLLSALRPLDAQSRLLSADTKSGSLLYKPLLHASGFIFPVLKDIQKEFEEHTYHHSHFIRGVV